MKRQVRQRCGFGCVVCGIPIYEYEHIVPYSEVAEHAASNLTLLCPTHHREKTNGLLPLNEVRAANDDPINLQSRSSSGHHLRYGTTDQAIIEVGSNTNVASHSSAAIMIDGIPLVAFRFESGRCFLNIMLADEYNDPLLAVKDNELVLSMKAWDATLIGRTLTIRAASGDIFIEVEFHPPNRVVVPRGRILLNGVALRIRPDALVLVNNNATFSNNHANGAVVLFDLGSHPSSYASVIRFRRINRYFAAPNPG